ncbi:MAG: hypothetical protein JSS78_05630 [Bacteroidetes bacterium]|nr:hypothetical protein [Bacteroidota bacterium]
MRYLTALAACCLLIGSCTKSGDVKPTREDDLRSGKWQMSAGTLRFDPAIGADTTYNFFDSLPSCRKDDYLVFSAGMSGTQNSPTKCDPSQPDLVDFGWYLENNGNTINFINAFQTFLHQSAVSAPFTSYTGSSFTIQYRNFTKNIVDSLRNDTLTYTYSFKKK